METPFCHPRARTIRNVWTRSCVCVCENVLRIVFGVAEDVRTRFSMCLSIWGALGTFTFALVALDIFALSTSSTRHSCTRSRSFSLVGCSELRAYTIESLANLTQINCILNVDANEINGAYLEFWHIGILENGECRAADAYRGSGKIDSMGFLSLCAGGAMLPVRRCSSLVAAMQAIPRQQWWSAV